jgi:hypothetical protein
LVDRALEGALVADAQGVQPPAHDGVRVVLAAGGVLIEEVHDGHVPRGLASQRVELGEDRVYLREGFDETRLRIGKCIHALSEIQRRFIERLLRVLLAGSDLRLEIRNRIHDAHEAADTGLRRRETIAHAGRDVGARRAEQSGGTARNLLGDVRGEVPLGDVVVNPDERNSRCDVCENERKVAQRGRDDV